jgi:hypothetical protein
MKIPDDWHMSVVPLEILDENVFVGTGFLMNFYSMPLLVTNKHVMRGKELQYRINRGDGRIDRIKIGHEDGYENYCDWFEHPDSTVDLAIHLVPHIPGSRLIGLNFETIGKNDEVYDGREIFYWGFPLGGGAEDEHQHHPIMRSGIVAQNRFHNKYLIEANVYPGSSGSPVFTKPIAIKEETTIIFKAPRLIGIVSSYIPYREQAISKQTNRTRIIFEENSGLAMVMNAHTIYELIDSREFRDIAEPLMDELDLDKLDLGSLAYDFDPRCAPR